VDERVSEVARTLALLAHAHCCLGRSGGCAEAQPQWIGLAL